MSVKWVIVKVHATCHTDRYTLIELDNFPKADSQPRHVLVEHFIRHPLLKAVNFKIRRPQFGEEPIGLFIDGAARTRLVVTPKVVLAVDPEATFIPRHRKVHGDGEALTTIVDFVDLENFKIKV